MHDKLIIMSVNTTLKSQIKYLQYEQKRNTCEYHNESFG